MTQNAFATLPLDAAMLENLTSLGYTEMTPIQAESLPRILAGKDLIAKAKTGSGKTAAFAIGLLNKLNVQRFAIQSLVLCPTRELADQVAREIRRLARANHNVKVLTLCGGVAIGPQIGSLEHGAHIVVGTPGRILDHLRKGTLKLDQVTQLVLDEADRMLDMGFADAVDAVLAACNLNRQTLLFSATYPDSIRAMSEKYQHQPEMVSVETETEHSQIEQRFFELASDAERLSAIEVTLSLYQPEAAVIFANTKQQCQAIADYLTARDISALALHGDLEQRDRDRVMVRFANKSARILVATDVAARGIDVKGLDLVIVSELSQDPEVHVHRVGRTGRAGEQGQAVSLVIPKEVGRFNRLEDYLAQSLTLEPLPRGEGRYDREPLMRTINIEGGKKDKLRAGDILGALTKDAGIAGTNIGKIDIFDMQSYVAVAALEARHALSHIQNGKLKGRKFRARII